MVVDSWGGQFQTDQTDILFNPFHATSGIKVTQLSDGENIFAKVESQANQKVGGIDLVHGDASWLARGAKDNLWSTIDYASLGSARIYDDARDAHGLGILYWSYNIVFVPAAFSNGGPSTWADVWAYAKSHPKRVALFGARPDYVLEVALMASGLPADQVYPLTQAKIDQAYASLDQIKNDVVWYDDGGQVAKAFESGQVDVGMDYGGDAFGMTVSGQPVTVVWNQGIYTRDYWLIPANAPHKQAALQLMAYAVKAQVQADFAKRTGYGPVNPDAAALIDADTLKKLPSVEPQKSMELNYDYQWWGANDDAQLAKWTGWLRG